ncbi:hypothetical protein [Hymenobacter sp. BT190]|uniref:hypothetical protein n=1 Tax=Hymenobacter sp. BT190 TaxID=2763505 RepID=UPI0016519B51|nr:hypothetical protein [Hymenobacter sp. BT190]MBC6698422.1 hypothetical protein [Hymenobacter sp. BT190]
MLNARTSIVAFTKPLTSPPRVHHPGTRGGLLEVAGTRKRRPATSTVGELPQLARVPYVFKEVFKKELFAVVRAEASAVPALPAA